MISINQEIVMMRLPRRPLLRLVALLVAGCGGGVSAWEPDTLDLDARAPFVHAAGEELRELYVRHGSIESLQRRIDGERAEHPDAVLVIRLDGRFTVSDQPLRLGSRMNLVLEPGAELVADSQTAVHLVEFRDAELAGVYGPGDGQAPGVLDGNMRSPAVVRVVNSAKIHLDHLE